MRETPVALTGAEFEKLPVRALGSCEAIQSAGHAALERSSLATIEFRRIKLAGVCR
jgi:hypothetical protein